MGSCENPPVAHRFIRFVPLFLTEASDDIFIGDLTLVLYDESKSYTAYYREWPGVGNTDQTLFELKFEGKYSYETSPTSPDGHFLRLTDIGQLVPSATNDKVTFILTLNKKINRPYASTQVQGRVSLGVSPLFSDCP